MLMSTCCYESVTGYSAISQEAGPGGVPLARPDNGYRQVSWGHKEEANPGRC